MSKSAKYRAETRKRAARMVLVHQQECTSQWGLIESIAYKIDCTAQTLRNRLRQAERDRELREGLSTCERENGELCRPTRSCTRRRRILPRQSSAAGSSHEEIHRRPIGTWQGHLYAALVIDVYARRIVGWKVSSTIHIDFVRCAGAGAACAQDL